MDSVKKYNEPSWRWTNERHLHFLNTMEDSFVRTMLENNTNTVTTNPLPPLDRYLPDSCESTVDLQKERQRRHSSSDISEQRSEKKTARKLISRPYIASHEDQVVPQGNRSGDHQRLAKN